MTAPCCQMCAAKDRITPLHIRAGVHLCPICDRGYPPQPTPARARHAKEKP